jgi:GTP:adenosylcobinamide-phosphate guanylyltransferase
MNTDNKLMKMNALLLAGGIMTPDDPLYAEEWDGHRALIDIHGKPMVQWVIDALAASDAIGELYIIGLPEKYGLQAPKPIHFLPDEGGLFDNIRGGVLRASEGNLSQPKVIVATADIPALQPYMVDWLAEKIAMDPTPLMYYNVIEQSVMEKRFPNARRSFVPFKDIAVCGGDMNVIDRQLFSVERPIWKKLAEARKHPFKQVSYLGFYNLILVALRLVTLEGAVKRVCKKLNLEGRAILCPYAEIAMDADKPNQLMILRQNLEDKS